MFMKLELNLLQSLILWLEMVCMLPEQVKKKLISALKKYRQYKQTDPKRYLFETETILNPTKVVKRLSSNRHQLSVIGETNHHRFSFGQSQMLSSRFQTDLTRTLFFLFSKKIFSCCCLTKRISFKSQIFETNEALKIFTRQKNLISSKILSWAFSFFEDFLIA